MSKLIQRTLIKNAWNDLEVQVRTEGYLATDFELDRCTYRLLGYVDVKNNEVFVRESARYLKGMGAKISESTLLEG